MWFLTPALLLVVATLLQGCSKKSTGGVNVTPEKSTAGKSQGSGGVSPEIKADLNQVSSDLNSGKYETVAVTLGTLRQVPKTPAEHDAYANEVRDALAVLAEKSKTDPKAAASYQMLRRAMVGR